MTAPEPATCRAELGGREERDDGVASASSEALGRWGEVWSEAVFVGERLPWSTLGELLRVFGLLALQACPRSIPRSLAAVAVVLCLR
ncbi:MAG: hypothetical protein ACLP0J_00930 [Solirubrobacteraceae bacterium]